MRSVEVPSYVSLVAICAGLIGLILCLIGLRQRERHAKRVAQKRKEEAEKAAREAACKRSETLQRQRECERRRYLDSHSSALSLLSELNSAYTKHFYSFVPKELYKVETQSKSGFDSFDPTKFLRAQIAKNFDKVANTLYYAASNREEYKQYQLELQRIRKSSVAPSKLPPCFNSMEDYRIYENRLFEERLLQPALTLTIRVRYTSPKNRNSYSDYRDFAEEHIGRLLQEVSQEMKQRVAYRQTADYQRNLVTPSLRIKVFKRDGYRCQICGRSAKEDGVALEVDHIVPVSKGGKTELSNLQTLCRDCNRGKGVHEM